MARPIGRPKTPAEIGWMPNHSSTGEVMPNRPRIQGWVVIMYQKVTPRPATMPADAAVASAAATATDHAEPVTSTAAAPAAGPTTVPSGFGDSGLSGFDEDDAADPLSRKLELAEEFRQIGDMEGARDLLQEVVSKASGSLKSKAQGMLEQLG